jgi:DNA-binding CsgD family transcriptional regulator
MADRGRPLPWNMREEIRRLSAIGNSRRAVARIMGVDKKTVDKYVRPTVKKPKAVAQSQPSFSLWPGGHFI